jgi:hypothetical protein
MNDGSQIGIGMVLCTVAGYMFRYLGERDKYRYDAKLLMLGNQNKEQECRLNDQADKIVKLEGETQECKEQHKTCEDKYKAVDGDIREIRTLLGRGTQLALASDTPSPEDTPRASATFRPDRPE